MLIGYPEGLHVTALLLVSKSQPRVLGTHVLRTRLSTSSSAIVPRMSIGKALDIPRNAKPNKR